jgi:hypothetical protein
MTWDDVIDRLRNAGLTPGEEIYMEHYGKVLAVQRKEFAGRNFRCTYGVIQCEGLRLEVFLFPSEGHLHEFLEVIGDDPWYVPVGNAVIHFPECDPATIDNILDALSKAQR